MLRLILFLSLLFLACKEPTSETTLSSSSSEVETEKPIVQNGPTLNMDHILGTAEPAADPTFALIENKYADREGLYMHKEAYQAFKRLHTEAQKRGINLVIRSAARNFNYQKGIWERKWNGNTILSSGENAKVVYPEAKDRALKILEYSSMPGTSRHHWGTDIDLNSFENSWFEEGEGLKLFEFMETVGKEYGFCRPYTSKGSERPEGYNEEKWHYSYVPVSKYYTEFAKKNLKNEIIKGFQGSEVAVEIDVVNKYVLGINQSCNH